VNEKIFHSALSAIIWGGSAVVVGLWCEMSFLIGVGVGGLCVVIVFLSPFVKYQKEEEL
jgi:hypothetical protein